MRTDFFPESIDQALMQTLGDAVDYVVSGERIAIAAIVDYSGSRALAVNAYATGVQTTIEALKSDVPNVKQGAVFYHNNTRFKVDDILNETDNYILLSVKRG